MEEIKEVALEELEDVAGGKTYKKVGTVLIVGCEHACNARRGPGKQYDKWGHAFVGKTYNFYGWSGRWARLKIDGHIKYVYRDYIEVL